MRCVFLTLLLFIIWNAIAATVENDPAAPPESPSEAHFYFNEARARAVPTEANTATLKYVHALFRHGDRTPSILMPNDVENGQATWPEGLGELTSKGLQQQYRLGQWLRKRYDTYLGSKFKRKDIYVRSSDYSRTLMSAQANLAGMFPISTVEKWSESLEWHPIPVHTVDKDRDIQLNENLACPTAKRAVDSMSADPKVIEIEKAHEGLLRHLEEHSGVKKPLRLRDMWSIFDSLNCEFHHQDTHKWPSWINASVWAKVQQLYDESAQFMFHNVALRRLRGGALVSEMLERMVNKSSGILEKNGPTKMYLYSAHDTTLAACLSTFGIVPKVFPLYATTVLVELHERNGQNYVEVYYKNVTDVDSVFQMEVVGCGVQCELFSLTGQLRSLFPENWHAECAITVPTTSTTTLWVSIGVLCLTNSLCLSVICVDVIIRRRKTRGFPRNSPSERKLMAEDEEEVDLAV